MNTCYNPFSLDGMTILVTGASSGIGRATAIECSKMGAKVVISGRNAQRLNDTYSHLEGEGHIALTADLTDKEDLKQLADQTPQLDGAILCSGIFLVIPCMFSNSDRFEEVYKTNLFSPIELSRLLVKKKKIIKSGSIVYISSTAGLTQSIGNSIYGSAKAALSQWMRYFAQELKPKQIRVNTVSPGMVETFNATDPDGAVDIDAHRLAQQKYIYGRYGKPEEVAYASIYLVSKASKWVTGTDLLIDGGILLH